MIFRFVVAHCRWLAGVPFLPQLFDAMLLAWTLVTDRRKLRAIELLQSEAQRTFGVRLHGHRFGGTEFRVGARELGHVHGNGLFDANIGRLHRAAAVAAGTALPHHVFPRSGWVSLWMRSEEDVAVAIALMHLATQSRSSASTKHLRSGGNPNTRYGDSSASNRTRRR